jgi:hypothetical protein
MRVRLSVVISRLDVLQQLVKVSRQQVKRGEVGIENERRAQAHSKEK